MKCLILSQSDIGGGAAKAALRLHNALIEQGVDSTMQVAIKKSDFASILGPENRFKKAISKIKPYLGNAIIRLQKPADTTPRSPNFFNSGLVKAINNSDYDVVNIHWINNEFISIEDIGKIKKPIVLTLHDMWAFCGAEHYATDEKSSRWCLGYQSNNRPYNSKGLDIDKWVWNRKRKSWKKSMHIVAPSQWLSDCVKRSYLMHDWPVETIPNVLDLRQFQPWDKNQARTILGLPINKRLILFGAMGGTSDPRKGWYYLESALNKLSKLNGDFQCVVFGQSKPEDQSLNNISTIWMGHINDEVTISLLYSAADVMVVPSLQENLPQTATEAQACGCPVVAFNCTGLPDVVDHLKTGYLAKAFDTDDFANGINVCLSEENNNSFSLAARQYAQSKWDTEKTIASYIAYYKNAIKNHSSNR